MKSLLCLAIILGLSACSARKLDVEDFDTPVEDKFVTDIKGDGIKLFSYNIKYATLPTMGQSLPQQQPMGNDRGSNGRKPPQNGNGPKQAPNSRRTADLSQWTQQVELGLNKTIAMTQFCREGYIELSRIIEAGRGEIRGECNDGANEEDLVKFKR